VASPPRRTPDRSRSGVLRFRLEPPRVAADCARQRVASAERSGSPVSRVVSLSAPEDIDAAESLGRRHARRGHRRLLPTVDETTPALIVAAAYSGLRAGELGARSRSHG